MNLLYYYKPLIFGGCLLLQPNLIKLTDRGAIPEESESPTFLKEKIQ